MYTAVKNRVFSHDMCRTGMIISVGKVCAVHQRSCALVPAYHPTVEVLILYTCYSSIFTTFILHFGEPLFSGQPPSIKAGVHLKAVFWLGIMFLMQISRLRFKQSRICSLITHIYVLRRFVNFLVIFRFIWRQIVFLKGLVKFMEIGNFEDLVLF